MSHNGRTQFRRYVIASLALALCAASLFAADEEKAEEDLRKISFRTQKPMVSHLKTDKDVAETTKLLKQIGCEVAAEKHNGHIDVKYECRYWRSIKLRTTEEAKQWDEWLTGKGFFVVHNSPPEEYRDTFDYRLEKWNTLHFKTKQENEAYYAMFKMLGCEVKLEKHGDHDDIMVRCGEWVTLGVPSDDEAHAWMGVLKKLGFQTAHEHASDISKAPATEKR